MAKIAYSDDMPLGPEDYDDFDDEECGQCGGDGYYYSCDDEGACAYPEDGCEYCMRRCDWCNPLPKEDS